MICRRLLIGTGLAAMGLGIAGCDFNSPPLAGFDPQILQKTERNSANGQSGEYLLPLPTTREDPTPLRPGATTGPTGGPAGPNLTDDPIVRMTLQEVMHRAVMNNHDVKVAGYQPAIEGTRAIEEEGNFDLSYFTNIQYKQQRDLTGGQTFNSFGNVQTVFTSFDDKQDLATFQTGFKQNLQSGGQVQLQYQTQYSWFNPQRSVDNPFYESDLTLQLTQPLLRNFGYDVNQAQITISRDTQKESVLEFRKAIETTAADVEKTYWTLVRQLRVVQIEQDLVTETEATYSILYDRWQKHLDVSQLQVSQALTRLESRRGQLRQAKSDARDSSDQLKQLMSDPEFPISSNVLIFPADNPMELAIQLNPQDEIDSALEYRFELGEEQLKIDAATVTVMVAKNNLLPQLNFIGSLGTQGAAADWTRAVLSDATFRHIDFTFGLQLEGSISNKSARAILNRTELQRQQEIERYLSLISQISTEVKINGRAVDTAWDQINLNRKSRFAAEDALNRILDREKAGEPLKPEFVELKLNTQDQLASALQAEAQAIAQYNIALSALEQAKGTLLKYNNVMMVEEPGKVTQAGMLR